MTGLGTATQRMPAARAARIPFGESSTAKSPDVLHDREAGSKVANEARILSPQAGSLTFQAGTLAGRADVLAGEATADGIDSFDSIGSKDKTFRVFSAEEGGAQHCQRDYLALAVDTICDWLEEKL